MKRIAFLTVATLAVFSLTGCIAFASLVGFALDAAQAVEVAVPNTKLNSDIQAARALDALDTSTASAKCKVEGSLVIVDEDLVNQFAPVGPAQEIASIAVAALDSAEVAANCPSSPNNAMANASIANAGSTLNNGIRGTQAYADTIAAVQTGKLANVKAVYNAAAAKAGVAGIQ